MPYITEDGHLEMDYEDRYGYDNEPFCYRCDDMGCPDCTYGDYDDDEDEDYYF